MVIGRVLEVDAFLAVDHVVEDGCKATLRGQRPGVSLRPYREAAGGEGKGCVACESVVVRCRVVLVGEQIPDVVQDPPRNRLRYIVIEQAPAHAFAKDEGHDDQAPCRSVIVPGVAVQVRWFGARIGREPVGKDVSKRNEDLGIASVGKQRIGEDEGVLKEAPFARCPIGLVPPVDRRRKQEAFAPVAEDPFKGGVDVARLRSDTVDAGERQILQPVVGCEQAHHPLRVGG